MLRPKFVLHSKLGKDALWARVMSDYKCQLSAIEGMKEVMGGAFAGPREHKGTADKRTGKFISTKKLSQLKVPKGPYTLPYLLYAYDVPRTTFQRKRKEGRQGGLHVKTDRRTLRKNQFVIENRDLAASKYNARFFYATESATKHYPVPAGVGDSYLQRYTYWGQVFDHSASSGGDLSK